MEEKDKLVEAAARIVTAYVSRNRVVPAEVPGLISSIHKALASLSDEADKFVRKVALKPAVLISKSITADYIICLEDGKRFKSLKRHLRAEFDLSAKQYRERWGLPADYPMVAPNYAKKRSKLAKQLGLGKNSGPYRTESKA